MGATPGSSAAEAPSDAQSFEQLAKSGTDLSKLHRVEFQLRFRSEDAAEQAAVRLEDLAFATTIEHDEAENSWVVLASKRMYPVESDLKQLGDKVRTVAADGLGSYEGWRARLTQ
jgi:hypothetical protein